MHLPDLSPVAWRPRGTGFPVRPGMTCSVAEHTTILACTPRVVGDGGVERVGGRTSFGAGGSATLSPSKGGIRDESRVCQPAFSHLGTFYVRKLGSLPFSCSKWYNSQEPP
jgi:hypothetical protein